MSFHFNNLGSKPDRMIIRFDLICQEKLARVQKYE